MGVFNLLFNKNKLLILLIALGFFLSQFYLWSSGLPQFSHLVIILAIIILLFRIKIVNVYYLKIFFVFLIYVIFVNTIWYLIYLDFSYINSTIYWIFNFLLFLLLTSLGYEDKENLIKFILFLIPFSYFLEIFIWLTGLGRYYFSPRYNGLFNDPNQMAFWILSTCAIYLFLSKNQLKNILIYFLALFLIGLTMSRSAFLGFLFITIALLIKQKGNLYNKIFLIISSILIFTLIFTSLYLKGFFDDVIVRFSDGFDQKNSQTEERGFEMLLNYPEYLIFGAGQGGYQLYNSTGVEIHSTWFGIIFYYGIIGFLIFIYFMFSVFKKLSFTDKFIFLGPMFYGFFTYNARTIIFWFLVVVFIFGSRKRN